MAINKPLRLNETIAKQFNKNTLYGRVTAPFTIARSPLFSFFLALGLGASDCQLVEKAWLLCGRDGQ
eukprot:2833138-Rhodomonas_salina.1